MLEYAVRSIGLGGISNDEQKLCKFHYLYFDINTVVVIMSISVSIL